MVYTSNFANLKKLDKDKCVSIARGTPKFFNGEIFYPLIPTWDMIMNHKNNKITDGQYTLLYYEILEKINPREIIEEYNEKYFYVGVLKTNFVIDIFLQNGLINIKMNLVKKFNHVL